jgi:hypothetical protein
MDRTVYDRRDWRRLPREFCTVEYLFGEAVGPCAGIIDRHHVTPGDPASRSISICHRHHPQLEAALRRLREPERGWKTCNHNHPYPGAKEACERRLNQSAEAA